MASDKYLSLDGLEHVADYVNKKLRVVTSIPANPEDKDIVLYKGTTSGGFLQGSVYMYLVENYFAWTDGTNTYYTLSDTPVAGDTVYEDTSGTVSSHTVSAYDVGNDEITVDGIAYARNNAGDVDTSRWELQDTSIILNGSQKTGDEANFYAPTASGTEGQVLMSQGAGQAPTWTKYAGYCPTIIDDTMYFIYGEQPDVSGSTVTFTLDD